MPKMNQDQLYRWAQTQCKKGDLSQRKYQNCALMNFGSYLGPMTRGTSWAALQLIWARALLYNELSKNEKNKLGNGGWYPSELTCSYTQGTEPNPPDYSSVDETDSDYEDKCDAIYRDYVVEQRKYPPKISANKDAESTKITLTGAGQCAWFMDRVGQALKSYTQVGVAATNGVKILPCYHSSWQHNFVLVAPDATTSTAGDVVMFDAWALAFGVSADLCWGAKAQASWLNGVWSNLTIGTPY
jgi:hypothetical protein